MAHPFRITAASVAFLLLALASADAADITVTALFSGKAVIVVDNGRPRTVSVGQSTPEGVKLVSASSESAVIEFEGKRQTLLLGQGTRVGSAPGDSSSAQVTLRAGSGGHFFAQGQINGIGVRLMVDTGASSIAMSSNEARRLGINYLSSPVMGAVTASGSVKAWRVKLDTVTVGSITLNNVDAAVIDGAYPSEILLGMTFLNRVQMTRDGDTLTLTRRY